MARPETTRALVRQFVLRHVGQLFTIPEICRDLGLDNRADHNTVRRALLYLGCVQDGGAQPPLKGRGGYRKPINLWIYHETNQEGQGKS